MKKCLSVYMRKRFCFNLSILLDFLPWPTISDINNNLRTKSHIGVIAYVHSSLQCTGLFLATEVHIIIMLKQDNHKQNADACELSL